MAEQQMQVTIDSAVKKLEVVLTDDQKAQVSDVLQAQLSKKELRRMGGTGLTTGCVWPLLYSARPV